MGLCLATNVVIAKGESVSDKKGDKKRKKGRTEKARPEARN